MERRKNDIILLEKMEILKELNEKLHALEEKRDKNLQNFKMEIFEKVESSIRKQIGHFKPSEKTLEFMENIKLDINSVKKDIEFIKGYLQENTQEHKEIVMNMTETSMTSRTVCEQERDKSDKKYAIKLIEKIVFTMIALILVSVFGALLNLVINK